MNDTIEDESGLQSIGPFDRYTLTIDGYVVPYMSGRPLPDGMYYLQLDGRMGLDIPEMYAHGVLNMIANAMAIGAGYSCFGKNSQPYNRFKTQAHRITMTPELESCEVSEDTHTLPN